MLLKKIFRFEASHVLPLHLGKCSRLHGHSWVLHVAVEGPINEQTGFVQDYGDISTLVKPIVESVDHKHLGQWATHVDLDGKKILQEKESGAYEWGVVSSSSMNIMAPEHWNKFLYPSSEHLLHWFGKKLKDAGLDWFELSLEETCTSYCELSRLEFEGYGKAGGNI